MSLPLRCRALGPSPSIIVVGNKNGDAELLDAHVFLDALPGREKTQASPGKRSAAQAGILDDAQSEAPSSSKASKKKAKAMARARARAKAITMAKARARKSGRGFFLLLF